MSGQTGISSGRRKRSVARVFMTKGKGVFKINGRKVEDYFPTLQVQTAVMRPLKIVGAEKDFDIKASVRGGGVSGQSDALSLAVSRALAQHDECWRVSLRTRGMLTCDSRVVERKKVGLRKARKAVQYSKR